MDLAVPVFKDDKIYSVVDIQKPKTGVIATAYESMKKNNIFRALLDFVSGSIGAIYDTEGESVTEPNKIKALCGMMPYMSAEAVALKVMALINEDDKVEGVYPCPRCGNKIITDADGDFGMEADSITDLEVVCMNGGVYTNNISVVLSEPVVIKNKKTGDVLETIENFDMKYPTINDCIMAGQNMMEGQEIRVQFKVYLNAISRVNGKEVDKRWLSTYGMLMFNNMYSKDHKKIGDAMQEYGLKKTVKRECCKCGKVWNEVINTSNFFASGLQPT